MLVIPPYKKLSPAEFVEKYKSALTSLSNPDYPQQDLELVLKSIRISEVDTFGEGASACLAYHHLVEGSHNLAASELKKASEGKGLTAEHFKML